MDIELLSLLIQSWPQGVGLILIVYFANKFFGWLAPIVEMYVKSQMLNGEVTSRALVEMNELMRIMDTRLAALEHAILGAEFEKVSRPPQKSSK